MGAGLKGMRLQGAARSGYHRAAGDNPRTPHFGPSSPRPEKSYSAAATLSIELETPELSGMGHSRVFGRIWGGTSQNLAKLAPCSVLIVK
jgi:hypothetical protein